MEKRRRQRLETEIRKINETNIQKENDNDKEGQKDLLLYLRQR